MFTNKFKVLPIISGFSMILLMMLLPVTLSLTMLVSTSLLLVGHYLIQNYDIDYKYWFSFLGQLVGFIFFVMSFLLVFIMGANLITQ